jgi:hypothetical protein
VAGQRSRVLHPHRHSARGRERPPLVPGHHEGGRIGEDWTPRELRHSFVSILSDNGVTIEEIADLVGHKTTVVTQKVYRHQLKPVITTGATMMNFILDRKKGPSPHEPLAPRLAPVTRQTFEKLVGLRGLEPRTSSLSGKRSNRLSYSPSETAVPAGHDRARLETPTGKVTASVTVTSYSVSLRVTSIPPPRCVTRL